MSNFKEKKQARYTRLGRVEQGLLNELSTGDILIGFLLSARSTKKANMLARERAKERYLLKIAVKRLEKEGYIATRGGKLCLTVSGEQLLKKAALIKNSLGKIPWDGKWRVIVFDIPQSFASLRVELRMILKRAGFRMLQQSVWVFPHECKELSEMIKHDSRLKDHVLYGVFESIEGDLGLRKKFGLH